MAARPDKFRNKFNLLAPDISPNLISMDEKTPARTPAITYLISTKPVISRLCLSAQGTTAENTGKSIIDSHSTQLNESPTTSNRTITIVFIALGLAIFSAPTITVPKLLVSTAMGAASLAASKKLDEIKGEKMDATRGPSRFRSSPHALLTENLSVSRIGGRFWNCFLKSNALGTKKYVTAVPRNNEKEKDIPGLKKGKSAGNRASPPKRRIMIMKPAKALLDCDTSTSAPASTIVSRRHHESKRNGMRTTSGLTSEGKKAITIRLTNVTTIKSAKVRAVSKDRIAVCVFLDSKPNLVIIVPKPKSVTPLKNNARDSHVRVTETS
jgi:hypothetical protein